MCAGTDVMIGCRESDIVHYKEICEKRFTLELSHNP